MDVNDYSAKKFWDAYRVCVEQHGVIPQHAGYYVKWVRSFVDHMPGKRLVERTGKDIGSFLAELAQRSNIAEWQIRQAERALKILYEVFLPQYAPDTGTQKRQSADEPASAEEQRRPFSFRDRVVPGEIERQFPGLLRKLQTEIRNRHYSYRTENSYADWVRRFIAFHRYADPLSLNLGVAVKESARTGGEEPGGYDVRGKIFFT
jgi:hypothetical protein